MVYLAYSTIYIPKVTYVIPATIFSEQQCRELQGIIMATMLPKMGVNRHMPRKNVFGPSCVGGLGIVPFHTLQYIVKIKLLLHIIRMKSPLDKLIDINWHMLQR